MCLRAHFWVLVKLMNLLKFHSLIFLIIATVQAHCIEDKRHNLWGLYRDSQNGKGVTQKGSLKFKKPSPFTMKTMPFCSFKCVQIFSFILITLETQCALLCHNWTWLLLFLISLLFSLRMPKFPCHICFFLRLTNKRIWEWTKSSFRWFPCLKHSDLQAHTKLLLFCEIHFLFYFSKIARQSFVANFSFSFQ